MTEQTPPVDPALAQPAEGHEPGPPESEAERQTRDTIRSVSRLEESN